MEKIIVSQEINIGRVADVLCGAVDPGYEAIRYWGEVRDKVEPTAWTFGGEALEGGKHYRHYYPLNPGGALVIRDNEADGAQYTLDIEAVRRGLQLMAEKYPEHFADLMGERDDNTTSDVLVQLALFGDIIYS